MKKWLLIAVVFFLTGLTLNTNVYPVDNIQIDTLRGIRGMDVFIGYIHSKVEEGGLTKDQIRTDVELKLRLAGIKVPQYRPDVRILSGNPFLDLNVDAILMPTGLTIWSVRISINQVVRLTRDPTILTTAPTWEITSIESAVGNRVRDAIRGDIKDKMDIFINDYLSVNPKRGK